MFKIFILSFCTFFLFGCIQEPENELPAANDLLQKKRYKITWHWEGDFTEIQKDKLRQWIIDIGKFTKQTIGVFQFDVHYYFHLSKSNEPVPNAYTSRRKNQQAVHFHVDPSYSSKAFMEDWTAQHEISHLSLPFINKEHMWFSEGYATFMSRKIMTKQGYYTPQEFDSIYYNRILKDEAITAHPDLTIPELADQLKRNHNYPSIYYLGSSYFYIANQMLMTDYQTTLGEVIKKYQKTNRTTDDKLADVLISLDSIVQSDLFISLFNNFQTKPSVDMFRLMVLRD